MEVYEALWRAWGAQHWWPADSPWEMMVGAMLTQNTAWVNVERAIERLRREDVLTVRALHDTPLQTLAEWIRPSGYFNLKARRLRALTTLIVTEYGADEHRLLALPPPRLRQTLLSVWGIGPETADSILLYAAQHPVFVIDAYTRRFMERHGWLHGRESYDEAARTFTQSLPPQTDLFNEFHALIVRLGKEFCRPNPRCQDCPLRPWLNQPRQSLAVRTCQSDQKRRQ